MNILITGGAGFVGSNLARIFKKSKVASRVVCFDNLKRRGSEINLQAFRQEGIEFVHGDVRNEHDLQGIEGSLDVVIDGSAEPSVLAGMGTSPRYLLDTNLMGTLNCLEFCRQRSLGLVFLSTSRVYSLEPLKKIPLKPVGNRFAHETSKEIPGLTPKGITEIFPTDTPRSLYGATKLASELFVQEYCQTFNMPAVINRCGVIAGPGQFGKVDQGVFTLWVANHYFGKSLTYTGWGGEGLQVRDLLHPQDLADLLQIQLAKLSQLNAEIFNIGGGLSVSTSLKELTAICQTATGRSIEIAPRPDTSSVDIPFFVTDSSKAMQRFDWSPRKSVKDIVSDIYGWIDKEVSTLRPIFG